MAFSIPTRNIIFGGMMVALGQMIRMGVEPFNAESHHHHHHSESVNRNELAIERTDLAQQRTNLAWVRTGLAGIGLTAALWAIQKEL